MQHCRWLLTAGALVLVGTSLARPTMAQAQAPAAAPAAAPVTAPAAVPKHFVASQFLPGPGRWISTVDNFDGLVGMANIQGTGKDNKGNTLDWEVDVRVMQGIYIGQNGRANRATFCFT
jgi:hypothetical protein